MTAGVLTNADHGEQFQVPDASCYGVLHGMELSWGWFFGLSCSTDPVAPGTVLSFSSREDFPAVTFVNTVASITATPPDSAASSLSSFDPATAGQFWGLAFCSLVGLYLLSLQIGSVLRLIRGR